MALKYILAQKRVAILKRWLQLIQESYPAYNSEYLKQEQDRFGNPIGHTISKEIEVLYEELLHSMDCEKLTASLDNIIRISSVQDFLPSQAMVFIFLLKTAIREEIMTEMRNDSAFEELLNFDSRIDKVFLLALDIYSKCREKIYEIRVNEVKAERERALTLLERTNTVGLKLET
ncbi:RsbRD N-terminal domain-containing protein [Chloroflexota bacterium]